MATVLQLGPWSITHLVSIGHEINHTLAREAYPYTNGEEIEDMGGQAESIRVEFNLKNEDFDRDFEAMRDWFKSRFSEPVEMFHPDFGTIYGYPENVSFTLDRRIRFASFNFSFVESGLQEPPESWLDINHNAELMMEEVAVSAQQAIAEDMARNGVPDVPGNDWSLLEKWADMGSVARDFATRCASLSGRLQSVISSIRAPADAFSSSLSFVDSLSGNLAKSLCQCGESYLTLARQVKSSNKGVIAALIADLVGFDASAAALAPEGVYRAYKAVAAATVAKETARLIEQDEQAISAALTTEQTQMDDDEGRPLADSPDVYLITPEALEEMIAMARSVIQGALFGPADSALKSIARDLTDKLINVKLEYMTTRELTVPNAVPLHKLLLDNGLDYKAAERVAALNSVKNPTFMTGKVKIYAS